LQGAAQQVAFGSIGVDDTQTGVALAVWRSDRVAKITSTREAYHELHDGVPGSDTEWAKTNEKLFAIPDAKEGAFVGQIYSVAHFQANIERQKLFKGGRNADAFIVARAFAIGGSVVTAERFKPNAVKLPNICDHFKIPCLDLERFMEEEGWEF
jgi:hypothetical protein